MTTENIVSFIALNNTEAAIAIGENDDQAATIIDTWDSETDTRNLKSFLTDIQTEAYKDEDGKPQTRQRYIQKLFHQPELLRSDPKGVLQRLMEALDHQYISTAPGKPISAYSGNEMLKAVRSSGKLEIYDAPKHLSIHFIKQLSNRNLIISSYSGAMFQAIKEPPIAAPTMVEITSAPFAPLPHPYRDIF